MNAVQLAIDTNNEAVRLLEAGYTSEALEVFRSAAQVFYLVTAALKGGLPLPQCEDEPIQKVKNTIDTIKKSVSAAHKLPLTQRIEPNCFIVERALTLRHTKREEMMASYCAMESATVLFNMGLSYTLSNTSQSISNSNKSISNAVTLYGMAYSVASRFSKQVGDSDTARVVMACLNNLGMIHHEMGEYTLAREYFEELSAYIMSMDSSELEMEMDKEMDNERRQFLLNAILLNTPGAAPAA